MLSIFLLSCAILFGTRWLWATHMSLSWRQLCRRYIILTGQPSSKLNYYAHIHPMQYMVAYFWINDFQRFIVNADESQKILDYFEQIDRVDAD